MSKIRTLRRGESLPFSFDRGGESTDGFICTLNVAQFPGDTPTISRVIPLSTNSDTGNAEWSGLITSAESDTLTNNVDSSLWWAIGILSNTTTGEEEQIAQGSVRFNVSRTWV